MTGGTLMTQETPTFPFRSFSLWCHVYSKTYIWHICEVSLFFLGVFNTHQAPLRVSQQQPPLPAWDPGAGREWCNGPIPIQSPFAPAIDQATGLMTPELPLLLLPGGLTKTRRPTERPLAEAASKFFSYHKIAWFRIFRTLEFDVSLKKNLDFRLAAPLFQQN